MLAIVNPEYPSWPVLQTMLLVAGGLVAFMIVMTLVLAIITWILRLVFIPKVRYQIVHDGVDQMERSGFELYERY